MDNVLNWIKGNRETFIGSAVIILALAIFGVYFFMHYRELRDSAWKDLFIAQQIGYAGNVDEAKTKLDEISANYGNTAAAGFAVLTKGDMLFAQDKFKDAGAEYTKLLSDKNLGPFALYDLGKCAESSGDLAGAQVQYSAFLSRDPEHFMAPEVHSSLAHVQELAGQKDLAKAT
jgi:tetratricopeptide (TPR) repeat protein